MADLSRNLTVSLTSKVDGYVAGLKQAQAATLGLSQSSQRNLKTVGAQMQDIGRKMTTFVTLPLAAGAAVSVKAAMDWESAWTGVTKTVDGTSEQMERLEQDLRDMAKELPATHTEIAAVAEAAGQLGVGVDDVAEFTKVMIDLGETTNLSANEAATALARFMNVMGTSQDDVSNLGSTIVDLGNNFETSEAEITEMGLRLAAAGRQAGLSESDVLAFAAALTSVGIEAEAGGTAFSTVFTSINDAVIDGGAKLETFAAVAGVSVGEFRRLFEEDAASAIALFVGGMGRMSASGQSTTQVFKDLGLSNARTKRSVTSLGQAQGVLTDAIETGRDAWQENTALLTEAEKRYGTASSRFEMVRNRIVDLAIDLGEMLLPALEAIVNFAGDLAGAFQGLPGPVQAAALAFGGLLATAGPLIFIAGSLVRNWVTLRAHAALLTGSAVAAAKGFSVLSAGAAVAFAAFKILGQGHLNAGPEIDTSADALVRTTVAALMESDAAREATGEIDALATAHLALSQAIFENTDDELRQAFLNFNAAADQTLGILTNLGDESTAAGMSLMLLDSRLGQGREASLFFFETLVGWGKATEENVERVADALGLTSDEVISTVEDLRMLRQFAIENKQEVADMARAYLDLQISMGGAAQTAVLQAEAIAGNRREGTNAIGVFKEYIRIMAEMSPAQREAAGINLEFASAVERAIGAVSDGAPALDDFAESTFDASAAVDSLGDVLDAGFMRQLRDLAGLTGPNEGWMTVLGIDDLNRFGEALHDIVDPQRAFVRSQDAIWEASQSVDDAVQSNIDMLTQAQEEIEEGSSKRQVHVDRIEAESTSLEANTEAGRKNRDTIFSYVDALLDGADAQIAAGDSIKDVTNTLDFNKEALIDAAVAAGLNEDEVRDLVEQYGLVPDLVATTIKLSGERLAQRKIEQLLLEMDELDEDLVTHVLMIAETEGAWAALAALRGGINNTSGTVTVNADVSNAVAAIRRLSGLTVFANVLSRFRSSHGRFVPGGTNMLSTLGEAGGRSGDEVVLPLGNPSRMSELLGMSQVGPRVAAAMSGAFPAGGGGGTVMNVSINMPPGANGDDVLRALQRLQRTRGPLPLRVA